MDERKKDFKWRYQPPLNSDKAKMLAYIQNRELHPSQDKTAMIVTALNAYYLPLALYGEGSCSRETLELILLDSVSAIANHLKYMCAVLEIDPVRVSDVLCGVFQIPLSSTTNQSKFAVKDEDLNDFDFKDWNLAGITTDSTSFSP
ncbi:hypothetical protein NIES2107_65160 [Nostoc carneum NIES-2107]|nr:hypothetical protein NIES2107_65160 [Nostoc carneum NIES-2107]